jgi:hypothetical protein
VNPVVLRRDKPTPAPLLRMTFGVGSSIPTLVPCACCQRAPPLAAIGACTAPRADKRCQSKLVCPKLPYSRRPPVLATQRPPLTVVPYSSIGYRGGVRTAHLSPDRSAPELSIFMRYKKALPIVQRQPPPHCRLRIFFHGERHRASISSLFTMPPSTTSLTTASSRCTGLGV